MAQELNTSTDRIYVISVVAFVLACVTILPYVLLLTFAIIGLSNEGSSGNFISVFLNSALIISKFLVWITFALSVFAIYKIIREKHSGFGFTIFALIISLIAFSTGIYLSYLFETIRQTVPPGFYN